MQAFLSLAFGVEAFLMSVHKKHDALDQSVHGLLALTMWACAGCVLLEMARPRSVLASAARSLSCMMQGMWMIQVGCCTCWVSVFWATHRNCTHHPSYLHSVAIKIMGRPAIKDLGVCTADCSRGCQALPFMVRVGESQGRMPVLLSCCRQYGPSAKCKPPHAGWPHPVLGDTTVAGL